jgi:hypothetical protein
VPSRSTNTGAITQSSPSSTVKDRVQQLEAQVEQLLNALTQSDITPESIPHLVKPMVSVASTKVEQIGTSIEETPIPSDAPGLLEATANGSDYVGSSHWLAIVNQVGHHHFRAMKIRF